MIQIISHKLNSGINIPENAINFDLRVFHSGKRFRCEYAKNGFNKRLQRNIAKDLHYEALQYRALRERKKRPILVYKCWDGIRISVAVAELIANALNDVGESVWVTHQELDSNNAENE